MNTQTMCNIDAVMWLMTCICIHAAAPAAAGANIMNREHTQCGALYHASVIEQWASFKNFASRLSPRNMRWRSQRIDRIGASNVSEWPRPTWIDWEKIFRTGDNLGEFSCQNATQDNSPLQLQMLRHRKSTYSIRVEDVLPFTAPYNDVWLHCPLYASTSYLDCAPVCVYVDWSSMHESQS